MNNILINSICPSELLDAYVFTSSYAMMLFFAREFHVRYLIIMHHLTPHMTLILTAHTLPSCYRTRLFDHCVPSLSPTHAHHITKATAPDGVRSIDPDFPGPKLLVTNAVTAVPMNTPQWVTKPNGDIVEEYQVRAGVSARSSVPN